MKTIKEIRESIDGMLDHLQSKAEAAQLQMSLGKMELEERIASQHDQLKEAAADLQAKLNDISESGDEVKGNLQTAFDELQLQLNLGAMDSRDAMVVLQKEVDERVEKFNAAIDSVKAQGDGEMADQIKVAMEKYLSQAANLKAELEACADKLVD